MRLRQLFEDAGKTVAVTFGRLNPPTIGHQKLIDAVLKQKADAHFLFVSQTQKTTGKNQTRLSNPIPFDIKLGFIQKAFPNINIGDTSANTVIGMLQYLEKQGFENVIFVGGSDRVAAFEELFNKQNGVDYNLKSINIVSSGARDPDADGAEGMSASKMRAAAIENDFESFKTGLPSGLQGDAKEVFSAVRQGLEPWLEQKVGEGIKSKIAGAALAAANLIGNPAQASEEPVKPITIAYVMIDGEMRKYNLGDKFDNARDAEKFISDVLDKKGLSGYTLDIKHGYPKKKDVKEAPIEFDSDEPMNPMIYGAGGNPAKLQYRMMRAANQLKDLAARAQGASAGEWQTISKHFDELSMNISQIKHGLEELAKQRRKGGVRSRGIDPMIDSITNIEESIKKISSRYRQV
jgi:hypothetical protein